MYKPLSQRSSLFFAWIPAALFLFLFVIPHALFAQEVHFDWVKHIGPRSTGFGITVNPSDGSIYTCGTTESTVDYDPGTGVVNITASSKDAFVTRSDASGNLIWVKTFSGPFTEEATGIGLDQAGNIYVSGFFSGTVDFDPGPAAFTLTAVSSFDAYIVKLDTAGALIWAKQIGGTGNEYIYSFAVDAAGNAYAAGNFSATADFDPGTGTFNITKAGVTDVFVMKLNSDGTFAWAKNFGGTGATTNLPNFGNYLAVDSTGNVYTSGLFKTAAVDFDPGTATFNLSNALSTTGNTVFISKLDNNGNFVWAKHIESRSSALAPLSLTVSPSGKVHLLGRYPVALLTTSPTSFPIDFDPGAAVLNLNAYPPASAGSFGDYFVLKFSEAGEVAWARQMGSRRTPPNFATITLDNDENVYAYGGFTGTADFDPGPDTAALTAMVDITRTDIFLARLDSLGMFTWVHQIGGAQSEIARDIFIDQHKTIYAIGGFYEQIDFDPGPNPFLVTSADLNYDDLFTLKWKQCYASVTDSMITTCDSITLNDSTYTVSGLYTQNFISAGGCDSTIHFNLTINNAVAATITETACKRFSLNGEHYDTSGTYIQHLTTVTGCDSVLTIQLTVNNADDSVILNLNTLQAHATGAVYQWIDCQNNNQPVAGATGRYFTPETDGMYALVITQNGCTDTSGCVSVQATGINETIAGTRINIFPNPATDHLYIRAGRLLKEVSIRLYALTGQLVRKETMLSAQAIKLNTATLQPGLYLLDICAEEERKQIKIIIQ